MIVLALEICPDKTIGESINNSNIEEIAPGITEAMEVLQGGLSDHRAPPAHFERLYKDIFSKIETGEDTNFHCNSHFINFITLSLLLPLNPCEITEKFNLAPAALGSFIGHLIGTTIEMPGTKMNAEKTQIITKKEKKDLH